MIDELFEYESSKSISIQFFCLPIQTYISSGLIEVLVVKIRNFKIQLMDAQEN